MKCDGTEGAYCNNGFDSAAAILTHLLTNIPATGIDTLGAKDYDYLE